MRVCCERFEAPSFLTQEEWKYSAEIEAFMHNASRLKTIFQNETKLNYACGPVMRKMLHDGLSCGPMNVIDTDAWSKSKYMTHRKIFHIDTETFIATGKPYLTRALLETEWSFFR